MATQVSFNFHGSFKLVRSRMSEVLQVGNDCQRLTHSRLLDTSLGTKMRAPYLEWGRSLGLLDHDGDAYVLTPLGAAVAEHDPALESSSTKWLLHYHLVNSHTVSPWYFSSVFHELFSTPFEVDLQMLSEYLLRSFQNTASFSSCKKTATAILLTYTQEESLGGLFLLVPAIGSRKSFSAGLYPPRISAFAFLYTLMHLWDHESKGLDTMPLSSIYQEEGLAASLRLSEDDVNRLLKELELGGYLRVFRTAPPFHIVRHWDDSANSRATAMEKVWSHEH